MRSSELPPLRTLSSLLPRMGDAIISSGAKVFSMSRYAMGDLSHCVSSARNSVTCLWSSFTLWCVYDIVNMFPHVPQRVATKTDESHMEFGSSSFDSFATSFISIVRKVGAKRRDGRISSSAEAGLGPRPWAQSMGRVPLIGCPGGLSAKQRRLQRQNGLEIRCQVRYLRGT